MKERQLDAVCELVKSIHNSYNVIYFNDPQGSNQAWNFTLFDVAGSDKIDEYNEFYTFGQGDDQKFDEVINWGFFSYYNNPLIPKEIAEQIQKFNVWEFNAVDFSTIQSKKCIILGNKHAIEPTTRCMYYNDKRTAKEFKDLCIELRVLILEWLKDYGIEDLNISMSHHNLSKRQV
jgi:hypothetical protein